VAGLVGCGLVGDIDYPAQPRASLASGSSFLRLLSGRPPPERHASSTPALGRSLRRAAVATTRAFGGGREAAAAGSNKVPSSWSLVPGSRNEEAHKVAKVPGESKGRRWRRQGAA